MDLSGTRSCRVPESCPWESLRDTNSKKIVSLDLRDTIKGHDTIFVSLIVSLSCPLIVSLRDTNKGHESCRVPGSCPWFVSLNFWTRF